MTFTTSLYRTIPRNTYVEIHPDIVVDYTYTPSTDDQLSPIGPPELVINGVYIDLPLEPHLIAIPWPETGPAWEWLLNKVHWHITEQIQAAAIGTPSDV